MDELQSARMKRKTLTLKLPPAETKNHTIRDQSIWLVWRQGGELPKRIYTDPDLACRHAKELTEKHGEPFHVLRSWRIFEHVGGQA